MPHAQSAKTPQLYLRQERAGWSVALYDNAGYVKHLAQVESEIEAYRTARRIAMAYELGGDAMVKMSHQQFRYAIDKLKNPASDIKG